MGIMLLSGVASILILCLLLIVWGFVRSIQSRARLKATMLGIAAATIVVFVGFSSWMIAAQAPKGDRTIAELKLPDGREFLVRHYRHRWLEFPIVRFYARDTTGVWTSFPVYAELVNSNDASLVFQASAQIVEFWSHGYLVNSYDLHDGNFVHVDGPGSISWNLPPGIEPGDEEGIR